MASYKVVLKPSAEKDFRSLSRAVLARVFERIEELHANPFPQNSLKLEGAERMYRLRVGDYRIVYEVDRENRQITVYYVRHRREVYRGL